jgi:nitrite reductase/ring-hydroxylating ferredoxin subunit
VPVPEVLRRSSYYYMGSEDLPKERWYSREFHDLEVEKVWAKTWLIACREEEIPEVGDHVVFDLADRSLIVVRSAPDRIQAFHNSCLHKGTTLRSTGGNVPEFRCPFHGWTWKLDGSFRSMPCGWDFEHVDARGFRLPEPLADTWGGYVFVNMDRDAVPLLDYLGELTQHMERWPPHNRWKAAHVARVIHCNWKVALEAFLEAYHVVATHPQTLLSLADENSEYDIYPGQDHFTRIISVTGVPSPHLPYEPTEQDVLDNANDNYMIGSLAASEGQTAIRVIGDAIRAQMEAVGFDVSDLTDVETSSAIQYHVFPNYLMMGPANFRFRPNGNDPDTCIMELFILADLPPGSERQSPVPVHWLGEDQSWTDAPELGMFGAVVDQDTANMPLVQKGMHASAKPGITLANYQDIRIRHYHHVIDKYIDA